MNNKQLGTEWERRFCELMAKNGFWVHFINPNASGAQPFDVIAVKGNKAFAFDCKTCKSGSFTINRLEQNQMFAFDKWLDCGNLFAYIAIRYENGNIYIVDYEYLLEVGSFNPRDALADGMRFTKWLSDIKKVVVNK